MRDPKKPIGLCFRCECRAAYLESVKRGKPGQCRPQCSDVDQSIDSCYMFVPVKPVVTVPIDQNGKWMRFGSLVVPIDKKADTIAECTLLAREVGKDRVLFYWEPKKRS